MDFIYTLFGYPLGWIMWACYKILPFYGVALILFTMITKLILLPFGIKQKKATAKMAVFQPKINEINKKFANDKQKQQEAMMKLYEEEGYNPMSSCLPALIQFPILFGLIDVVYKPMTHLLRLPTEIIDQLKSIGEGLGVNVAHLTAQLNILGTFKNNPGAFSAVPAEYLTELSSLKLTFLGIDFTAIPKLALTVDGNFNWLIILPLLSGAAAFAHSFYTQRVNRVAGTEAPGGNSMKTMMYIMPLFSVFIAFSFPAGLSFYWTLSSLFSLLQEYFLNKVYSPEKMLEEAKEEQEKRRLARKGAGKRVVTKEDGAPVQENLSQKELDRIRLAEARRRDAEKYGEEYIDVTEDDLK